MDKATCAVLAVVALILAVACSAACVGVAALAYVGLDVSYRVPVEETVASELVVDSPATLLVRNPVGHVTIRAGDHARVLRVEATKQAHSVRESWADGLLEQIDVQIEKENDSHVRVVVTLPEESRVQPVRVHLLVTVPKRVNLDVVNEAGRIQIVGTEGDVRVRSETGMLRMTDVTLAGRCDVMSTTGDIDFQGQLPDPRAGEGPWEVLLKTETGDIDVAVPADSRFALDAETQTGRIDAKFELERLQSDRTDGDVGQWLKGSVNHSEASPNVILRTKTGNIRLEPLS